MSFAASIPVQDVSGDDPVRYCGLRSCSKTTHPESMKSSSQHGSQLRRPLEGADARIHRTRGALPLLDLAACGVLLARHTDFTRISTVLSIVVRRDQIILTTYSQLQRGNNVDLGVVACVAIGLQVVLLAVVIVLEPSE